MTLKMPPLPIIIIIVIAIITYLFVP